MKTRKQKQEILKALTEQFQKSNAAMVLSFNRVIVAKDQELRNQLREVGAKYQVVKNTLARLAVKDTPFEAISDHFKGVTAIAFTENDPVVLSKTISKFVKSNSDFFTFKTGFIEGRVVDFKQVEQIANLPSKEELISKLLFLLNAPAQRLVSVIQAVPRNLVIAVKQIADKKAEQQQQQ